MKINSIFYLFPALLTVPAALADITIGVPTAMRMPQKNIYHADLLSSNAVRAAFKELRSIPVVSLDAAPDTEEVAVFEVKENLAYRRYDRMGDGALSPGKLFAVSLRTDIPGQDAALSQQIREMNAGDEALLNMDHIYVFRAEGNENVHACTRFAKIQPQPTIQRPVEPAAPMPSTATAPMPTAPTQATEPTAADAAPMRLQPNSTSARSVETRLTIEPDGNGGMRRMKVEVHREWTPTGEERIRKFINDVEVDPQTDQPLAIPGAPMIQPAAQPQQTAPAAPAPQAEAPSEQAPPIPDPQPETQEGF